MNEGTCLYFSPNSARNGCCRTRVYVQLTMPAANNNNNPTPGKLPSQVELEALKRAFHALDVDGDGRLSCQDILTTLHRLKHKMTKHDVEVMLWEVDEDLDGHISWSEFLTLYERGTTDVTGLEPRGLFHVVQFLMYDNELKGEISVEQTLQILFVRFGRELLDQEIQAIFGEDDRKSDGPEKRVTLSEYLEKVKGRTKIKKKTVTYPKMRRR